jgi:nucleotide-binding universal stress UspA family protein
MDHPPTPPPVVVGIDGSKAAIRAALWAVYEAARRNTPLRLVHVTDRRVKNGDRALAHAYHVLHEAWSAVEAAGYPVKLEMDVLQGDPVDALLKVSRSAAMICLGGTGTHDSANHKRRSTAIHVARLAFSPVAIINRRHSDRALQTGRWIIAALDESTGSRVLQTAIEEAQMRGASVLALTPWSTSTREIDAAPEDLVATLDHYLTESQAGSAAVDVCALPMPDDILNLLAQSATIDELVIVGPHDQKLVKQLVGPKAHAVLRKTNCSVLIDRNNSAAGRTPMATAGRGGGAR